MPIPKPAWTTSLAELPGSAAFRSPDAVAVVAGRRRLTFDELDRAAAGVADDLVYRGLDPGDPVGLLAGNGVEFPVAAYGILRAGGVLVPLPPSAPVAELRGLLRAARVEVVLSDPANADLAWAAAQAYDARCGAVVVDGEAAASAGDLVSVRSMARLQRPEPVAPVRAGSRAVILFSSGSGDHPKGVVHSHEGLLHNARCVALEMLRLTADDVLLGALPLAHSYGLSAVLNAAMVAGARIELIPKFDAGKAWSTIADRGVTVFSGVPTMFRRLVLHPHSSRNTDLRLCVVSGAPCPRDLARDVQLRLGTPLIERYGMTEASPLTWHTVDPASAEGDVGRAAWGVRVRAVDVDRNPVAPGRVGELQVRAPSMLLGYLSAEDEHEALTDGWLLTGDLGKVHPGARVELVGRLKDVILRGGYSVSAREVARALEEHPAVVEAAVVGVPDGDLGEEVAAAVVLAARSGISLEDLNFHAAKTLAAWKRPHRWRIVERLPRTALEKVSAQEVRRMFAGEPAEPV